MHISESRPKAPRFVLRSILSAVSRCVVSSSDRSRGSLCSDGVLGLVSGVLVLG